MTETTVQHQGRYRVIPQEVRGIPGLLWTIQDVYTGRLVYQTGYRLAQTARAACALLNGGR